MKKYFFMFFYLIISISLVYSQDDSPPIEIPSIDYEKYDLEWKTFISEEKEKNDTMRQSIIGWSIAIAAILVAFFPLVFFLIIRKDLKKSEELREWLTKKAKRLTKKIDMQEERIAEQTKTLNENALKINYMLPTLELIIYSDDEFVNDGDKQDDIFSMLVKDYKQGKDNSKTIERLKELAEDIKYKNKRYKIYFCIAYIHNDEILNKDHINLEEAEKYYELSLKELNSLEIDSRKKEEFKCMVLNDWAYTEIQISKGKNKQGKMEFYKKAGELLDKAIDILRHQSLKWANPYKNKGYYFGKLAVLEKDTNKQVELFIDAMSMYHMAFSLNVMDSDKKFEDTLYKSFNETKKEFVECLVNMKKG
jgi:tetratricopeptide (TPR) repeat protein